VNRRRSCARAFPAVSRVLHRLMAAMVLAMLFLGMAWRLGIGALPLPGGDPPAVGNRHPPAGGHTLGRPADQSAAAVGSFRLPPILPQDPTLYVWLRRLHTDFALLLFAVFLVHLGAH